MPEIYLRVCWEGGNLTEDDVINAMQDVPAEVHYLEEGTAPMVERASRAIHDHACGCDHNPWPVTANYTAMAGEALAAALDQEHAPEDCDDCGTDAETCPSSKRTCGHHCAHSWSHDACCWCGARWGEGGEHLAATPTEET